MTTTTTTTTLFTITAVAIIAIAIAIALTTGTADARLVDLVDTRTGSGGFGFGSGCVNPGAQVPFGAARLGPDGNLGLVNKYLDLRLQFSSYGGLWEGFYADRDAKHYALDPYISGMSHTHVVGAGAADWQNYLFTAVRVPPSGESPSAALINEDGYKSKWRQETEVAKPGYYAVTLDTPAVDVELTVAGTHTGMLRYTCQNTTSGNCAMLLDICHAAPSGVLSKWGKSCRNAQILNVSVDANTNTAKIRAKMTMHGSMSGRAPAPYQGITVYFYAEVSLENAQPGERLLSNYFVWENGTFLASSPTPPPSHTAETQSHSLGVILPSNSPSATFFIRSALSFTSIDTAVANLATEQKSMAESFESAMNRTQSEWEELLSTFVIPESVVPSSTNNNKKATPVHAFYSFVYLSHLAPTTYTEPSTNEYLGLDYKLHSLPKGRRFMSDFSLWDVYRSQFSLLQLSRPDIVHDSVLSMQEMTLQKGRPPLSSQQLPKWTMYNVECDSMSGHHSASIMLVAIDTNLSYLVEPYGLPQAIDDDAIYKLVAAGILKEIESSMPPPFYYKPGHIGDSLEYFINAGAVQMAAERRGDAATAAKFKPWAQGFRNVWDAERKLFCPRGARNGTFDCPAIDWLPYPFEKRYIESSAVDNRWYVPHDLGALTKDLLGGADAAAELLNKFFVLTDAWQPLLNTSLLNPYFSIGNEPVMLVQSIAATLGPRHAWVTQKWSRKMLDEFFLWPYLGRDTPFVPETSPFPRSAFSSLPGENDYGAISSWAVFQFLGIYPIVPSTRFVLTPPYWDRMSVRVPTPPGQPQRGLALTVVCSNRTTTGAFNYIASTKINGAPLVGRAWFEWADLMRNQPVPRSAIIELVLSPVPVTLGDPTQAPWVPSSASDTVSQEEMKEAMSFAKKAKGMMGEILAQRRRGGRRHQ